MPNDNNFMAFALSLSQAFKRDTNKEPTTPNLNELVTYAAPYWDKLCDEEKAKWKNKEPTTKNSQGKRTTRAVYTKRHTEEDDDHEYMSEGRFVGKKDSDGYRTITDYILPHKDKDIHSLRLTLGAEKLALMFVTPRYSMHAGKQAAPLEVACVVFSCEKGIIDHNSWLILPKLESTRATNNAKERSLFNKVPLELPEEDEDFFQDYAAAIGDELDDLMKTLDTPYRLVMGDATVYNIFQASMRWLRDEVQREEFELCCPWFSSHNLLYVGSLTAQFHKAATKSDQHPPFPSWENLVIKWKHVESMHLLYCGYHQKHNPTKVRGCALAAARLVVAEVLDQLMLPLGFPITDHHFLCSARPTTEFEIQIEETQQQHKTNSANSNSLSHNSEKETTVQQSIDGTMATRPVSHTPGAQSNISIPSVFNPPASRGRGKGILECRHSTTPRTLHKCFAPSRRPEEPKIFASHVDQ